jgi:hypothetical protein
VIDPEAAEQQQDAPARAALSADLLGAPRATVALELAVRALLVAISMRWLPPIFTGDLAHFYRAANRMSLDSLPYREVLWEFPPLTLVPLFVAKTFSELATSAATSFRLFQLAFAGIMVLAEYGSLVLLRRWMPQRATSITFAWTVMVLPIATLTWFRWDFMSVFFATTAVIAIDRRRPSAPWVFAGYFTRLWPAGLVVPQYLEQRRPDLARTIAFCAAGTAGWWLFSPSGFADFLEFRRGSGLQIESVMASVVRPFGVGRTASVSGAEVVGKGGWDWVEPLMLVALVSTVIAVAVVSSRRPTNVVAATGVVVIATMIYSRILSPQYLVWIVPFAAILYAQGLRRPAKLVTAAGLMTVWFIYYYAELVDHSSGESSPWHLVLLGRNILLVLLVIELARVAWLAAPAGDGETDVGSSVGAASPTT